MSVKLVGMVKHIKNLLRSPKVVDKEIKAVMISNTTKMVKHARANHRFNSVSGTGERSITKVYKNKKNTHTAKVWIDPRFVTTESGYNYMGIQHDGSRDGFQRSPISPPWSSKGGKGGIRHDHFVYNAIKKYDGDLKKDLRKIPKTIRNLFGR